MAGLLSALVAYVLHLPSELKTPLTKKGVLIYTASIASIVSRFQYFIVPTANSIKLVVGFESDVHEGDVILGCIGLAREVETSLGWDTRTTHLLSDGRRDYCAESKAR